MSVTAFHVTTKTLPRSILAIAVALLLNATNFAGAGAASPSVSQIAEIDLSKSFATKSPWRLVATQEPATTELGFSGEEVPGIVHLCLQIGSGGPCDRRLIAMPQPPAPVSYDEWEPHYLYRANVVYPRGETQAPLLLLQTAGMHSGDGDQAIYTQLLAYDPTKDRFSAIYAHVTGRNNNQEVRFIAAGPLQGSVISAEQMLHRPFGYWIAVNELTPALTYRQVLRYGSATRYNDGNRLAVIDSEIPNIEQRLGLWHPGLPLPLPASSSHACGTPRLSHMELWCE